MENQNSTELQSIGNSFRDLQQKIWSLKLDIAQLERELYETEFRKAIQEKKQALQILEDLENEKKTNIVNSMLQNGLKSVEFVNQKFTLKKTPWSLKINDEEMIPQEFKKEKVEIIIDKKAIKEKISNGEDIAGCEIVYSHNLVITPK